MQKTKPQESVLKIVFTRFLPLLILGALILCDYLYSSQQYVYGLIVLYVVIAVFKNIVVLGTTLVMVVGFRLNPSGIRRIAYALNNLFIDSYKSRMMDIIARTGLILMSRYLTGDILVIIAMSVGILTPYIRQLAAKYILSRRVQINS